MSGHMMFFGLGYCARQLAHDLKDNGWRLSATCRDTAAATALEAEGVTTHFHDGSGPMEHGEEIFADITHGLISIPPDEGGCPVARHHGRDLGKAAGLRWLGYLSTTGVYGDRDGDWVDEQTPLAPTTGRGRRRALAERQWRALHEAHQLPLHIFRLAGIYGPGRNPFAALKAGTARRVVKPGQVFGRIHVADIAATLAASIARPDPGAAYNLSDDAPAPPQDVIAHAAKLLGLEPPPETPFDEADMSDMGRSFYEDCKRVRNDRIKRELGVRLRYPSYREGLAALLEAGDPAQSESASITASSRARSADADSR